MWNPGSRAYGLPVEQKKKNTLIIFDLDREEQKNKGEESLQLTCNITSIYIHSDHLSSFFLVLAVLMGSKSIFKMHLHRCTLPHSSHILAHINWDRLLILIHFFGRQCARCDDCESLRQWQIQPLCWDLHSERRERARRYLCPSECHRRPRWGFSCGNYAAKVQQKMCYVVEI